jgi:hypothetical protein
MSTGIIRDTLTSTTSFVPPVIHRVSAKLGYGVMPHGKNFLPTTALICLILLPDRFGSDNRAV